MSQCEDGFTAGVMAHYGTICQFGQPAFAAAAAAVEVCGSSLHLVQRRSGQKTNRGKRQGSYRDLFILSLIMEDRGVRANISG